MIEVADLVPKGSSDLMKLSWEETEAILSCVLEGRKRYKLVTMETVSARPVSRPPFLSLRRELC